MANYDNDILEHYRTVAQESNLESTSTMADLRTRSLETELIINFVEGALQKRPQNTEIVIGDIGCGNGYTLQRLKDHFQKLNKNIKLVGFEYSPELRALAQSRFSDGSIKIFPLDVRKVNDFPDIKLDICICQ